MRTNNGLHAEKILQETFLRFLEKADPGRPGDFRTFLIHISHNLAVDYIKKHARLKNVEDFPAEADRRDFAGELTTVLGHLKAGRYDVRTA